MVSEIRVRVFDSVLDGRKNDQTTRNAADFWRPFCAASNWDFNYERIHSLDNVNSFFSKPIKEEIIIFSGHGESTKGFHLSDNEIIDGKNQFNIHENNIGKTIILSSCSIGANSNLAEDIRNSFQAKNLFAYRHVMQDRCCFLFESMLLTLIDHRLVGHESFGRVQFEEFKKHTDFLKNINKRYVKEHPMVFFD